MCRPVIDLWMRRPRKMRLSYISNDEEIAASRLVFGGQKVKFHNKATRWLGMWLDSKLSFDAHIEERDQNGPKQLRLELKALLGPTGFFQDWFER